MIASDQVYFWTNKHTVFQCYTASIHANDLQKPRVFRIFMADRIAIPVSEKNSF
jgi:hypothetical protein